jgi:formiminotetrahydrofolate cyclodeaminase
MTTKNEFFNLPLSEILGQLSSKKSVPGSGSAAALAAVLGASLAQMAASLTIGKRGCEAHQEEAALMLDRLKTGAEALKELALEDIDAYEGLLAAKRLPADTPAQKELRDQETQQNTITAAVVPLKIAEKAREQLVHNKLMAEIGNVYTVSDSAVAAVILEAAVRAALLAVEIDCVNISDQKLKRELEAKKARLENESRIDLKETLAVAEARGKPL